MAYNLYWAWHPRTRGLWSLIDRTAWTRYRNPIPVISGATDWSRLLDDAKFLAEYHDTLAEFDQYMANGADHWFQQRYGDALDGPIAYFCAEYGFHESLGIYSGGLGVLAGDHMKSASDMALPAIGVGLLYRKGYFRQSIDADGHQEHNYPDYDLSRLPLSRVQDAERAAADRVRGAAGPGPRRRGLARPGRAGAGPAARHRPARERRAGPPDHPHPVRPRPRDAAPPGAGPRRRRRPGDPGARASSRRPGTSTRATPRSCSPNAPASSSPAGPRSTAPGRRSAPTACSRSTRRSPPGNERFDADLVRRVAGPLLDGGGVPIDKVLELGVGTDDDRSQFDMTAFSLRLTNGANAVSQLHAETANGTWTGVMDHDDPGHHQRRPRTRPGSAPRSRTCSSATSTPTSTTSTRPRSRAASGSASSASRRATCGTPTCARSASSRISPRAGCAASSPATARRRPCWPSSMPRSTRRS